MKWWLATLNLIASSLIVYMVIIAHSQIEVHERDFQSEVLAQAIDTANGYAFRNALNYSSLDQEYEDLQTMTLDPTNVLRDFETMMCICYGMALSDENMQLVASCIDGGVLADFDGYYILQIANKPVLNDTLAADEDYTKRVINGQGKPVKIGNRVYIENDAETYAASLKTNPKTGGTTFDVVDTGNVEYALGWSSKLPYVIHGIGPDGQEGTYAMALTNANHIRYIPTTRKITRYRSTSPTRAIEQRVYMHNGQEIEFNKTIVNYNLLYDMFNYTKDASGVVHIGAKVRDLDKFQKINNQLATAINSSIKQILGARGIQMNYSVYLPSTTTQSGVNPVKSDTLLIAMSKASFAGKYAYLSEPILAGHRAVSKEYIVEYWEDVPGSGVPVRRYCYASQLPLNVERREIYYSEYEAMMAGCKPSLEYLTRPLLRELQSVE